MPSFFHSFSSNKVLLEMGLISMGMAFSLINTLAAVEDAVKLIKKELYLGGDEGTKDYVRWVRRVYEIDEETQMMDIMNRSEFE